MRLFPDSNSSPVRWPLGLIAAMGALVLLSACGGSDGSGTAASGSSAKPQLSDAAPEATQQKSSDDVRYAP